MMDKVTKEGTAPQSTSPLSRVPFLFVALLTMGFVFACTDPVDYSAYNNKNLIPLNQFDAIAPEDWTIDPGSYNNYEEVSSAAAAMATGTNTSGDSYAGWGSDATLRVGAPVLAASAKPAIYRLEVLNLASDGDFEAGSPFTAATGETAQATTFASSISTLGQELRVNLLSTEASSFSISGFDQIPYAVSFRFWSTASSIFPLGLDSMSNASTARTVSDPVDIIKLNNLASGTKFRFPFDTGLVGRGTFNYEGTKDYVRLNPNAVGAVSPAVWQYVYLDDFELVPADLDCGIRINIPVKKAGRPDLLSGGVYTLKLWVRNDHTPATSNISGYSAGTATNRFNADFISVSIHDDQSLTTKHGNSEVVYSRGLSAEASWKNRGVNAFESWTQLSFSFKNLMQGPSASNGLQIVISATNIGSSLRTAGSILITNPELFWSPD